MADFPDTAMILAAGLGTRMRPLTLTTPKPLIQAGGKTLVDHAIDFFKEARMKRIIVNSSYLADQLESHIRARKDLRLIISHEDTPLETGGGIRKALPIIGDAPFFVMNSDAICVDLNTNTLQRMWQAWDEKECDALLLAHEKDRAIGYDGQGDFFVGDNGVIRRRMNEASAPYVFTGVQLLHPRLFAGTPEGPFSMNLLYNRAMADDGTLTHARAIVHQGDWLHVGDIPGLKLAEDYFS